MQLRPGNHVRYAPALWKVESLLVRAKDGLVEHLAHVRVEQCGFCAIDLPGNFLNFICGSRKR